MKTTFKTLLITLPVALSLTACSDDAVEDTRPVVRPVKLFTLSDQNSARFRTIPATVVASEATQLSFRLPGEIISRPVKEGQHVKQGELIAKLDDRDLKNQLTQRQANYDLALAEFKRKQNLLKENIISQSSFDQVKTALTANEVALKLAKDNLQYASIFAPYSGRIGRVLVENHQFVQAKQPIVILQTIDTLDIQLELPEAIVANIKPDAKSLGYQPEVRFQSVGNQVFHADYKENATEPTPGTQSYRVTLTMAKPESLSVLPGMTASVTIDLKKITNLINNDALIVPVSALMKRDSDGKHLVWRFDPSSSKVHSVEVTVGEITDDGIQITGNLKANDQIVMAGISQLHDDQEVKPLINPRGL